MTPIENRWAVLKLHARITGDLLHTRIPGRLVFPFDLGHHDCLALTRTCRCYEAPVLIGCHNHLLAVIRRGRGTGRIQPALNDDSRQLFIGSPVSPRNRNEIEINVGHALSLHQGFDAPIQRRTAKLIVHSNQWLCCQHLSRGAPPQSWRCQSSASSSLHRTHAWRQQDRGRRSLQSALPA